jgi:sporulation protein YlmC with PRC-barrel domain
MADIAGWIASIATMIAAVMTASNLGSRVTGWGFVVFLVGSISWSTMALWTNQSNLLWSNLFLTLVNILGIWRWLGRRAKYDEGAQAAAKASAVRSAPSLFALSALEGKPVAGADGSVIAHTVDGMARCDDGRISYLIVSEGGVGGLGERLHVLPWAEVTVEEEALATTLTAEALRDREEIAPDQWPVRAPAR